MRRLSNNPKRGSMNWSLPRSRGHRTVALQLPKLGIRRLIKRNPVDGKSQPFFDKVTDTNGVAGLSGASPVGRINVKSKNAAPGTGKETIIDRSANRSLKRR